MRHVFAFFCFLAATVSVSAQEWQDAIEPVRKTDLTLDHYEKDSLADAVVLFDQGVATVDPTALNGTVLRRFVRIKLFKRTSFEQWGNVTILSERNRISKLRGATYYYDAATDSTIVTPLLDRDIHETRYNKRMDKTTFTMPNLSEGCVIEYSYVVKRSNAYLPTWSFQHSIPTRYSQYLLHCVEPFEAKLTGMQIALKHEKKYAKWFERWVAEDIPAFRAEPLMPHEDAYKSVLHFVSRNWSSINMRMAMSESFGRIIVGHEFLTTLVDSITNGTGSQREKLMRISDFIKGRVQWNETHDFFGDAPEQILKRRSGTSGDINLLFASMLNKAGIDVHPVLISTRDYGFLTDRHPSLSQFNNVLCFVRTDADTLMLDATERKLPFDALPENCLNHYGMVVTDQLLPVWVMIEPIHKSKTTVLSHLTLNDEGTLSGTLEYVFDGYAAFDARQAFEQKGEEQYFVEFARDKNLTLERSQVLNMTSDFTNPVRENYLVKTANHAIVTADHIYVDPYLALREEFNPFTETDRQYPIDLATPVEKNFIATVTLPEGYETESLPKSVIIALPDKSARYSFYLVAQGNKIQISSRLQMTRTLFNAEEYRALKEFYSTVIAKKSERIVIKKIRQ